MRAAWQHSPGCHAAFKTAYSYHPLSSKRLLDPAPQLFCPSRIFSPGADPDDRFVCHHDGREIKVAEIPVIRHIDRNSLCPAFFPDLPVHLPAVRGQPSTKAAPLISPGLYSLCSMQIILSFSMSSSSRQSLGAITRIFATEPEQSSHPAQRDPSASCHQDKPAFHIDKHRKIRSFHTCSLLSPICLFQHI